MDETANQGPDLSKRATTAGWTAGLSAVVMSITIGNTPEWPVAFAIAAIAPMVGFVCYLILKTK